MASDRREGIRASPPGRLLQQARSLSPASGHAIASARPGMRRETCSWLRSVSSSNIRVNARFELAAAVARAQRMDPAVRFIRPLALEPTASLRNAEFPPELRRITWVEATDGLPPGFIQDLRESTRRKLHPRIVGVPPDPVPLIGRREALHELQRLLTTRESMPKAKVALDPGTQAAPNLLSLVGSEGIGKWTLAHHAVRAVGDQFADGVIWLGEDGLGYPRVALRAYAEAAGIDHIFKGDTLDHRAFQDAFAGAMSCSSPISVLLPTSSPHCFWRDRTVSSSDSSTNLAVIWARASR
jgi:hypothetical protein